MLAEKLTVQSIVEPVCRDYALPLTVARGFISVPPRHEMAVRFRESGKEKMALVAVTDADPEGEEIAASVARSLRDDFGIEQLQVVKAALRPAQARSMGLPTALVAKEGSSRRAKFVADSGSDAVWELEALAPPVLQRLVREAIDSLLDVPRFNAAIAAEKQDAAQLVRLKARAAAFLAGIAPCA